MPAPPPPPPHPPPPHERRSRVIVPQAGKHLLVSVRAQNAVEDNVVATVQRIAGHLMNQADVRTARTVLLLENRPTDEILRYPMQCGSCTRTAMRWRRRSSRNLSCRAGR